MFRYVRWFLIALAVAMIALSVLIDLWPNSAPGFGTKQLFLAVGGVVLLLWSLFATRIAWQKQVLAGTTLVMSVGVAELMLRAMYAPHLATNLQIDEVCLFRAVPGARRMWCDNTGGSNEQVLVEINDDGFRGPPLAARDSALRVAVFGDSYIMAEFTPYKETFVKKLEAKLAQQLQTPVEAVNVGVRAYGPAQTAVRLAADLELLRPDLAVVCIFSGNDFGDLAQNKLFRFDEHDVLVPNEFQIGHHMRSGFADANNRFLLYKLFAKWYEQFKLAHWDSPEADDSPAKKRERFTEWRNILVAEYEQFAVDHDDTVEEWSSDRYDADVAATPNSDSARFKKKMMQAVLGRIQQTAAEAQVPLLLVVIPSSVDVCDDSETIEVDLDAYPAYRREALTDAVAGAAQQLGIQHVNLFRTFRRADARTFYRYFDDHWNAAGQGLCAGVVADFITDHELLGAEKK